MKLTSDEVDRILAGIRDGMEVMVGGSRCHSTYLVNDAGELVVEDFDEGATEVQPCTEATLRAVIDGSPEAFLDVLRSPLRKALRDALLEISDRSPRDCLRDLLVYGECLHHRDLLEAVLGWPGIPPTADVLAQLASTDGLDVYHAIMSALGYCARSIAAGEYGVRFYAALEEMLGGREMPRWRRYRASFRDMAGDTEGALQDLAWELARPNDEINAGLLRREMATIADRKLLAVIAAAPDDDTPRLVWADALSERGDPRGELIVVQCTIARSDQDDPVRASLEPRVRQLMALHGWSWAKRSQSLERGFVDSAEVRWVAFAEEADALFALSPPLRELRFRADRNDTMADPSLVLEDPRLEHIPALDLSDPVFRVEDAYGNVFPRPFGPEVVARLDGRLPALRELTMRAAGLEPAHLERIGARTGQRTRAMNQSQATESGAPLTVRDEDGSGR